MLHRLRLLAEQGLAGTRSEAETTRAALVARAGPAAPGDRRRISRASGPMLESKLREMRDGNEAKLAEIQKTVNEQLHAAVEKQMNESFNRVIDQFAAVQKAMGDVQAVTAQIGDIKRLFSNVKTRGGWGETQVRAMLDDILPPGEYETNCKVRPDSNDVGGVRRAHADEGRRTGRCCRSTRSSRWRITNGCWRPRMPAMRMRNVRRRACWNGACAMRRRRSRRNTSIRRSRWNSRCCICRRTRCMPKWRASPG